MGENISREAEVSEGVPATWMSGEQLNEAGPDCHGERPWKEWDVSMIRKASEEVRLDGISVEG